jgi:UPF0755 protein
LDHRERTPLYLEEKMKKRYMRLLWMILLVALMLACSAEELFLGAYVEANQSALSEPAGTDDTPVTFEVEPGESVTSIANRLQAQGLISDAELFRRYVQYKGLDAGIQAGSYTLNETLTIPAIALALQEASAGEQQVTIPEGWRMEQVADLLAMETDVPPDAFLELVRTGWPQSDLSQKYTFLAQVPVTATLEGFLFPDTYRLPAEATAYDLVDRMLENFERQVTPEIRQGFVEHDLTLLEGVTLASIIEREAVVADERMLIAGVYYNRWRDGWYMGADPTVQYALGYRPEQGTWWKKGLTFDDLEVQSPYNTYRKLGLPPAPIASPGIGSIQAAAAPQETDYYYFMVDCVAADGSHVFAQTEAEHLANFNACGGVSPEE